MSRDITTRILPNTYAQITGIGRIDVTDRTVKAYSVDGKQMLASMLITRGERKEFETLPMDMVITDIKRRGEWFE